jgi:hypothetical protein
VEEKIRNMLEHISIGNKFLKTTPLAQQLREKIDKWDYMKLKRFCTAKEMTPRLKKSTERDEIFASYTCDKGLITRI